MAIPKPALNDPKYWRGRAEEMRAIADDMQDKVAREMVLGIAADYDKLAMRAEIRARSEPKDQ